MHEVMDYLKSKPGVNETYEVRIFDVWMDGEQIRVELYDGGEGEGSLRFSATARSMQVAVDEATTNTRGFTIGNPDSTVRGALMNLHWNIFPTSRSAGS